MASGTITHRKVTALPDNPNFDVSASEWNDSLIVSGGTDLQVLTRDSTQPDGWSWGFAAPGGFGNVSGPASSVVNSLAVFNATTGKLLADGGVLVSTVARTNVANIFTADQTVQNSGPIRLGLNDTSQVANSRLFRITNAGAQLGIYAVDDAQTTILAAPLVVNRNGDATIGRDVYEKGRTTPLGHWITVPFTAANFVGTGGMTWTVTAGNVQVNRYTLIGYTLCWTLVLGGGTLAGTAATQIQCVLPGGLTSSSPAGSGATPAALTLDASGTRRGLVSLAAANAVSVTVDAGGTFALGNLLLYFTILLPLN